MKKELELIVALQNEIVTHLSSLEMTEAKIKAFEELSERMDPDLYKQYQHRVAQLYKDLLRDSSTGFSKTLSAL